MKLRSIVLAGFLGAGLLMTSGCSDILEDILEVNVVYTVNGTGASVVFSVTGDTDTDVLDKEYAPHLLTGHSNYDVSYVPNGGVAIVSYPAGSVYMYAATTCTGTGYLEHEVNANKVNFANLHPTLDIPGSSANIVITQADGITTHAMTDDIGSCSINGAPSLGGIVFENNMTISLDGGTTTAYTVTGIDPDLVALGDRLKVDIVLFDDGSMTVVPMAGYDELVSIGAGAL